LASFQRFGSLSNYAHVSGILQCQCEKFDDAAASPDPCSVHAGKTNEEIDASPKKDRNNKTS